MDAWRKLGLASNLNLKGKIGENIRFFSPFWQFSAVGVSRERSERNSSFLFCILYFVGNGRIVVLIHVLYIILEQVSFNIMFCIKCDVITLGGFGDRDCIYMDKWALCGHFYSYVDPVWSLCNIGTGCHEIAQVVFWVELPVQRRLCSIFVKTWVLGKGDSME